MQNAMFAFLIGRVSVGSFFRMTRTPRIALRIGDPSGAPIDVIAAQAQFITPPSASSGRSTRLVGRAGKPPGLRLGQPVTMAHEIAAGAAPIAHRCG
jgi:hypothetical protein